MSGGKESDGQWMDPNMQCSRNEILVVVEHATDESQ